MSSPRAPRHLPLVLLLLAVALAYANSLHNGFHFDDFHAIVDNPAVRSLRYLPRVLTDATAFSVLPANQTWRPAVTASLALDYALARGYEPLWFHLSTLFWFSVLIVLLAQLIEGILDRTEPSPANRWLALLVAAWFGLHPAMAETVNYIIQRGDVYCTLGCVAGLYLFARWPKRRRLGLYLIPFTLAMLSKPPAIVFPLLVFLYVALFENGSDDPGFRTRVAAALRATWPAFALALALLALTRAMTPPSYTPSTIPAWSYRLTQPYVWLCYAGMLFAPLHLNVDTDLAPFASLHARACAGLAFAALLLVAIVLCARPRNLRPIAFGLAWFLLTQLPTSLYALSEVENDHRLFFSFPGLMLAVVWTLHLLAQRIKPYLTARRQRLAARTASALILVALAANAYATHRRNEVWRNERALWADDIRKSPGNGRGWMMEGVALLDDGAPSAALVYFQHALPLAPFYSDLELNLAIASGELADRGDATMLSAAEPHFQRALLLAPGDDRAHAFYARWLLEHGRAREGAAQAATAVQLNPQRELGRELLANERAHAQRAAIQRDANLNASLRAYQRADYSSASTAARAALSFDPKSALAWNNLGAAQAALAQFDDAIASEQHALAIDPALTIARNNLALYWQHRASYTALPQPSADPAAPLLQRSLELYNAGHYTECIAAARQALALDSRSAIAWNNIAAAESAQQHWDAAIAAAEEAATLDPTMQLARNNLAWALSQRAAGARN